MAKKNKIESKNIKRFYVPKTLVLYFSETDLNVFDDLSKLVVEYTDFVKIGDYDLEPKSNTFNRIHQEFYS